MTLTRRRHDLIQSTGGYRICARCGKALAPGQRNRPLCPGDPEKRSSLARGARTVRRSPPKRSKPVPKVVISEDGVTLEIP